MNHRDQDERDFESYLDGKHPLASAYKELRKEQPGADVDRAILELARAGKTRTWLQSWRPYFGVAATALLAVGLVRLIPPTPQAPMADFAPPQPAAAQTEASAPQPAAAPTPSGSERKWLAKPSPTRMMEPLELRRGAPASMGGLLGETKPPADSIGGSAPGRWLYDQLDSELDDRDEFAEIRALLARNQLEKAAEALQLWRSRHPDTTVPNDLRALLEIDPRIVLPAAPRG